MSNEVPQYYKDEAYSLIRSIYKFIPFYNQIKGTSLGIQFMMNTMGLSAAIVELWSTRDDIKNQLNMDLTVLLYQNGYPPEWDEEVFNQESGLQLKKIQLYEEEPEEEWIESGKVDSNELISFA